MNATSIEWCDFSVNPIRARRLDGGERIPGHFCEKISAGCKNCYASKLQSRFGMLPFLAENRGKVFFVFDSKALHGVRSRKKPARIFWCDMTDIFLLPVQNDAVHACFQAMMDTPQHTHLVLTKRPNEALAFFQRMDWPSLPPHIHFGVSLEDQETADQRIPVLLQIRAAVRWVSYEPALGPVDFNDSRDWLTPVLTKPKNAARLDWVVCGGESGGGARPMHPDWARSVRDQCVSAGVPFFFKQWGGVRKKKAGRLLDGREWNEYPK